MLITSNGNLFTSDHNHSDYTVGQVRKGERKVGKVGFEDYYKLKD